MARLYMYYNERNETANPPQGAILTFSFDLFVTVFLVMV